MPQKGRPRGDSSTAPDPTSLHGTHLPALPCWSMLSVKWPTGLQGDSPSAPHSASLHGNHLPTSSCLVESHARRHPRTPHATHAPPHIPPRSITHTSPLISAVRHLMATRAPKDPQLPHPPPQTPPRSMPHLSSRRHDRAPRSVSHTPPHTPPRSMAITSPAVCTRSALHRSTGRGEARPPTHQPPQTPPRFMLTTAFSLRFWGETVEVSDSPSRNPATTRNPLASCIDGKYRAAASGCWGAATQLLRTRWWSQTDCTALVGRPRLERARRPRRVPHPLRCCARRGRSPCCGTVVPFTVPLTTRCRDAPRFRGRPAGP